MNTIRFSYYPDDFSDEVEATLPCKYEVCPVCRGKGTTVNPAIDGHGISAEEFEEDPDFRDDYMNGVYDVPCRECDGLRVIAVVDEQAADPELLKHYHDQLQAEWECRAAERSERFMYGE